MVVKRGTEFPKFKVKREPKRLERTSTKRCPECKFKIRGPNHAEGDHHKRGGPPKKR